MNSDELKKELKEAKKFSLSFKTQGLQSLIFERYRSLTIISSISFALVGILISISYEGQFIKNIILAYVSFAFLTLIAICSLGRYLYLIRDDIKDISKQIAELFKEDWSKPLEIKKPKADYWPEIFYIFLILSIALFVLSLMNF